MSNYALPVGSLPKYLLDRLAAVIAVVKQLNYKTKSSASIAELPRITIQ